MGCSTFETLWRIVILLSTPALVTLVVVNALWVWNELLIALVFLQNNNLKSLMPIYRTNDELWGKIRQEAILGIAVNRIPGR